MKTGFAAIDKKINNQEGLYIITSTNPTSDITLEVFYNNIITKEKTLLISRRENVFQSIMARHLKRTFKKYEEMQDNYQKYKEELDEADNFIYSLSYSQWCLNHYFTDICSNIETELKNSTKVIVINNFRTDDSDLANDEFFVGKIDTLQQLAKKYKAYIFLFCQVKKQENIFSGNYKIDSLGKWQKEFIEYSDGIFAIQCPVNIYFQNEFKDITVDYYNKGKFVENMTFEWSIEKASSYRRYS